MKSDLNQATTPTPLYYGDTFNPLEQVGGQPFIDIIKNVLENEFERRPKKLCLDLDQYQIVKGLFRSAGRLCLEYLCTFDSRPSFLAKNVIRPDFNLKDLIPEFSFLFQVLIQQDHRHPGQQHLPDPTFPKFLSADPPLVRKTYQKKCFIISPSCYPG